MFGIFKDYFKPVHSFPTFCRKLCGLFNINFEEICICQINNLFVKKILTRIIKRRPHINNPNLMKMLLGWLFSEIILFKEKIIIIMTYYFVWKRRFYWRYIHELTIYILFFGQISSKIFCARKKKKNINVTKHEIIDLLALRVFETPKKITKII